MRPMTRILAPLTGETGDEAVLSAAARIARPFGAHISAVFFKIDPWSLITMEVGPGAVEPILSALEEQEAQAARQAHERFDAWCAAEDISLESVHGRCCATWHEAIGNEFNRVARLGRLSDLTIVSRPGGGSGRVRMLFEAALFETGRPVLLAPAADPYPLFETAIVAWNGSIEAAQATAFALPLLGQARRVEVFSREERYRPEADAGEMASYLSQHDIPAQPCPTGPAMEEEIGAELLETCRRAEAGLLVMGAYTRSRLREFIFGGVTRHVLDDTSRTAVLMCH